MVAGCIIKKLLNVAGLCSKISLEGWLMVDILRTFAQNK